MPEKDNLYFAAIIPPDEICREAEVFKHEFADRFGSKAALNVIPHITVKAPFKLPGAAHDDLLLWFNALRTGVAAFELELNNFGSFVNKYSPVVYLNPVMNDSLAALQKAVIQAFRQAYPAIPVMHPEWHYKPHLTVAYKDLQPALFEEAWKEYQTKTYHAAFTVNSLHLLQHKGRRWATISSVSLGE